MWRGPSIWLLGLLVNGPALAADAAAARATLHLQQVSGPGQAGSIVAAALQRALASRGELSLVALPDLLEPAGEADRALRRSASEAARGRALLDNLEIPEGVAALRRAVALAQGAFHRLGQTEAGRARFAALLLELAFAHHLAGAASLCEQMLAAAVILQPGLELDPRKYPPDLRRLLDTTRFLQDELGTGSLRVSTAPAGATVRVGGAPAGRTPLSLGKLPAGPHLVTVSLPGYRTLTRAVTVEGGKERGLSLQLVELPGRPAQALAAALEEASSGAAPSWLSRTAEKLQRELLVLGTLAARPDLVEVNLFVFDARQARITGQIRSKLSVLEADREADSLVAALLARLARSGPAEPRPARGSWLHRFYRSSHFWPVVGGVLGAAALGTGIGLGVYHGTRGNDRQRRFITFY